MKDLSKENDNARQTWMKDNFKNVNKDLNVEERIKFVIENSEGNK